MDKMIEHDESINTLKVRKIRNHVSWWLIASAIVLVAGNGWYLTDQRGQRLEAEAGREAAFRRAELIIVSAPVSLIMCGETGHITVCNPKVGEMFGWTHEELIGKHISVLIPKDIRPLHEEKFQEAVTSLKTKTEDWLIAKTGVKTEGLHKDGTRLPVILNIRMIRYGGKIEFITSMRAPGAGPVTTDHPLPPMAQIIQKR